MADITNPEAIQFSNEIRPRCCQVLKLKNVIDDTIRRWYLGKNNLFPNEVGDMIIDGRPATTPISGADINNIMTQLLAIQTVLDVAGVMDIFTKPSDPID